VGGARGGPEVEVKIVAHSNNHSGPVMLNDNQDASVSRDTDIVREVAWLVQCFDSSDC